MRKAPLVVFACAFALLAGLTLCPDVEAGWRTRRQSACPPCCPVPTECSPLPGASLMAMDVLDGEPTNPPDGTPVTVGCPDGRTCYCCYMGNLIECDPLKCFPGTYCCLA